MKNGKRILAVTITHETDIDYDGADAIGTFDMEAKSEYAIALENWSDSHGYRYDGGFKFYNAPVENYLGSTTEEMREYVQQDYATMKSYNAGEWDYIGIRAEAKIGLPLKTAIRNGDYLTQTISSGGTWGLESNAGDYLKEIETEQLAELKTGLIALGFSKRAISKAFQNIERKDS